MKVRESRAERGRGSERERRKVEEAKVVGRIEVAGVGVTLLEVTEAMEEGAVLEEMNVTEGVLVAEVEDLAGVWVALGVGERVEASEVSELLRVLEVLKVWVVRETLEVAEKWEAEEVLELVGGEVGHVRRVQGEGNSGRGRR